MTIAVHEQEVSWPRTPGIGERAPRFALPDHGGQDWSLGSDFIAGQPLVLLFFHGDTDPAVVEELRAFREQVERFRALDAEVVAVTRQIAPSNAACRLDHQLPFRFLSDVFGEATRKYVALLNRDRGAAPALLTCVLTPGLRVAGLIHGTASGGHAARALDLLGEALAGRAPERAALHPPVLQIPGVLSAAECRFLIALHDRPDTRWNEPGDPEDRYDFKIRVGDHRRSDRIDYVINDAEITSQLDARLARRITPEVLKAFQYRVTRRETYHLACYTGRRGGFSIGHRDNSTPELAYRRFALSVNLNRGGYEGGELRFREYGEQRYQVPTGAALVFSSSLLHEALPVTSGRRFVLLSHLFGEDAGARPTAAGDASRPGPIAGDTGR